MEAGDAPGLQETVFGGREREFYWLWFLAAATYGAGDVLTTMVLTLSSDRLAEANGLVAASVDAFGVPGLVAVKLAVFSGCLAVQSYALRDSDDRVVAYAPPVVLAVVGAFATAYNLRLLVG